MLILGINVYHADTAACIISDGKIVAACEEERLQELNILLVFLLIQLILS